MLLKTEPDTKRQNELLRDTVNDRVGNLSSAYGTAAVNLGVLVPTDGEGNTSPKSAFWREQGTALGRSPSA